MLPKVCKRIAIALWLMGCTTPTSPAAFSTPTTLSSTDNPMKRPNASQPVVITNESCFSNGLATWDLASDDSVLSEQRQRGPHRSDFFERHISSKIDPAVQDPVAVVAAHRLNGEPILWWTTDHVDAVVDERFSGDLTVVDVPRLRPGERRRLGQLSVEARVLAPRDVLAFLLRADIVRTYWHIASRVCLLRETVGADGYQGELCGEHRYFTNTNHRAAFQFRFEINGMGELFVTGLETQGVVP